MSLRESLSHRFGILQVKEILYEVGYDEAALRELASFIFDEDEVVSYQALWVLMHRPFRAGDEGFPTLESLVEALFTVTRSGKRRLLLNLIIAQPMDDNPDLRLLDFCLEHMMKQSEPNAVRSLCMKLAYGLSSPFPELLNEYCMMLDMIEDNELPASLRAVKRNQFKEMRKRGGLPLHL